MPQPKSWTATDLTLGKLTIIRDGSPPTLTFERRYKFVDAQSDVIDQIAGGRIVVAVAWADLPQNIRDALTIIDTYTKDQALLQEGMND